MEGIRQNMLKVRTSRKLKQHKKKPTIVGGTRQNMIEACELGKYSPQKKKPIMMEGIT